MSHGINDFCEALSASLCEVYEWARTDPAKRDAFVASVKASLIVKRRTFIHDGPALVKAWRKTGRAGKPTWKVLFSLELEPSV